jgi:hypothetical protein
MKKIAAQESGSLQKKLESDLSFSEKDRAVEDVY